MRQIFHISPQVSVEVLCEWRNQTSEMPDGNPWDWRLKDLASVIKARSAS